MTSRKMSEEEVLSVNWECIIDYIAGGGLMIDALEHYGIDPVVFARWLRQDPERREQLRLAEEDQARHLFEGVVKVAIDMMTPSEEVSMNEIRSKEAGMRMVKDAVGIKNRRMSPNYDPRKEGGGGDDKSRLDALMQRLERRKLTIEGKASPSDEDG